MRCVLGGSAAVDSPSTQRLLTQDGGLQRQPSRLAVYRTVNVSNRAASGRAVAHGAVDQREQSVVATQTNALAWVNLGSALAHEDVAGADYLAAENLHATSLAVTVAAVA